MYIYIYDFIVDGITNICRICHNISDIHSPSVHNLDLDLGLYSLPRLNVNRPFESPYVTAVFKTLTGEMCIILTMWMKIDGRTYFVNMNFCADSSASRFSHLFRMHFVLDGRTCTLTPVLCRTQPNAHVHAILLW